MSDEITNIFSLGKHYHQTRPPRERLMVVFVTIIVSDSWGSKSHP